MAVKISDEEIKNQWIKQIDIEENMLTQEERQKRDELLLSKLRILLNENGFTKQLVAQMDTKYFVEKGFTIPESVLLTKPENTSHPSKEELRQLKYDEQTKILKLQFQNQADSNNQKVQNYYIIVLGPTNRGKTTFVFNMINKIYNITRDSLYRIKKTQLNQQQQQQQQQQYYDEYIVQIDQDKNYIFADFRGMGDFKLDFLGLSEQEENQNTLYTAILDYIYSHSNNILAILFCNSSSINRLGQDEKYQLQRFFELIPKQFEQKIQLILTYCTDNQPLMAVYESFEGMPENLKKKLKDEQRQQSDKFWFGINNANLYNPIDYILEAEQQQEIQIEQNQSLQKEKDEQFQEDYIKDFNQLPNNLTEILNQFDQNKHLFLPKIVFKEAGDKIDIDDDQNRIEQGQEDIEIPENEWPKLYYNQMLSILEEIQSRFLMLEQQNNQNQGQNQLKDYLKNKLKFEKDILNIQSNLQLIEDLKKQNHNFIISQIKFINYIKNFPLNKKENSQTIVAKKQTKFLYCRSCSKLCHNACHLLSLEEIYSNQKMCRKLQSDEFKKAVKQKSNYNQLTLEEKKQIANEYVKCRICAKNNNTGKQCKLEDHQVTTQIQQSDQKNIPYLLSNQNQRDLLTTQNQIQSSIIQLSQNFNPEDMIYNQFIHQYSEYRQSKKLQRLYQQTVFKVELEHQQLIENTQKESKSEQNQGLLQVDLDQRFKFLNAIQVQLKNTAMNDDFGLKLDEVLKIYSKFQKEKEKDVEQNIINISMSFAQSQQLQASNQKLQISNNQINNSNNLQNSQLINISPLRENLSFVNQNQDNVRLFTSS